MKLTIKLFEYRGRQMNKLWKYLFVMSILSCSQRHNAGLTIALVDSARLNDTLNVFVYTKLDALHESTKRYLAICKDVCDIKDEDKTVAYTPTYNRIDSVVGKRIYIASRFNVRNLKPTEFIFWINNLEMEDPVPNAFHKLISLDSCEIN